MSSRLIIALDYPSADLALAFVRRLSPKDCKLKVGFELFVTAGPDFVKRLVDQGFDVFLDLKFHDIPNTVAAACQAAARLGVWMINVHASGGDKMLSAAHAALIGLPRPPKLIAVTVLTSMDNTQLATIGIDKQATEQVIHLAGLSQRCGLDGVVCSAQEAKQLKQLYGKEFLLVTPGIRPNGSEQHDQSRVVTPKEARQFGVDYIVVGRPITQSLKPLTIINDINEDLV